MSNRHINLILVPGSWCTPQTYRKLIVEIQKRSFDIQCLELPTCNGARPPNTTFEDDVATVRNAVEASVSQGHEVVLLLHSYAAVIGSDAIADLTRHARAAKGLDGGVVHLFVTCGYIFTEGVSILSYFEEKGFLGDMDKVVKMSEDGTAMPVNPRTGLFHDLDPRDQDELTALVMPYNAAAFAGRQRFCGWKEVPMTFVFTTKDPWVYPETQRELLDVAKAHGAQIDEIVYDCGHAPHAKYPERLADDIIRVCSSLDV